MSCFYQLLVIFLFQTANGYFQCDSNEKLINTLETKLNELKFFNKNPPFNKQTPIYTHSDNLKIFADSKNSVIIRKKQFPQPRNPSLKRTPLSFSHAYFPISSCSSLTDFKYKTCRIQYALSVENKVHEKCDGIYFGVEKTSDIIDRQIWKIGTHHGYVMYNGHISSTVNGKQNYLAKLEENPGCGSVKMIMENDDEGEDSVMFLFNSTVKSRKRIAVDGEFSVFYVLVALYYPGQEVKLTWI